MIGVGTYNSIGCKKIVTDGFMQAFRDHGISCRWILFGTGTPPAPSTPDTLYAQIPDDWHYFFESEKVDANVIRDVDQFLSLQDDKLCFRPIEYDYEPYLKHLNIPSLFVLQLLHRPLIASSRRQTDFLENPIYASTAADARRVEVETSTYGHHRNTILISNSETTFTDFKNHYPEHSHRLKACIPLGATFPFKEVSPPPLTKTVLFHGRLTHQKGISHLLRPVPPGWRLIVVGKGKLNREHFENYGIEFHEWKNPEGIRELLSQATYCLFPSHYEPWGISLNEALLAGRVCVAQSGAGGHEEQIQNGVNGFLFDFSKRSFWDFFDELHSQGPGRLNSISHKATAQARSWQEHTRGVIDWIQSHSGV